MTNKKHQNYKYSELEYAKLIYTEGFQTKHKPTELRLVALYMKEVLGLKPKERNIKLYEFCEKWIPNYNRAIYFKVINRALMQASKKGQKLITIEKINIYQGEIEYLNNLEIDYNFKKVLFAFLVQMKLNKEVYEYKNEKPYTSIYFKGGKAKYANIKKISKIPVKLDINDDVIYFLAQEKLVNVLHKGLIVLDFLKNCCESGYIVVEVMDYENIGLYFDLYNQNPKVKLCEYCNNPFRQTKSDIKYCSLHKGYQPIEVKIIKCVDCGVEVEVDGIVKNKKRCSDCQQSNNKERYRRYNSKRK